jgi:hypothetical protein
MQTMDRIDGIRFGHCELLQHHRELSVQSTATPIWIFRTFARRASKTTIAQVWQWELEVRDGAASVSDSSFYFYTLRDCVSDAKLHGFPGDVDPSGTFRVSQYAISVSELGEIAFHPIETDQ